MVCARNAPGSWPELNVMQGRIERARSQRRSAEEVGCGASGTFIQSLDIGVEGARIKLRPQPRDLALGQLPRGEDRTIPEFVEWGPAIHVLEGLTVADRAHGRQVTLE